MSTPLTNGIPNPDKIPDAARDNVLYGMWHLQSRYGKKAELEAMMAAIDHVIDNDPLALAPMTILFCDSKASATYTASCVPCSSAVLRYVANTIGEAFVAVAGGHNGVTAECDAGLDKTWEEAAPDWQEPD